MNTERQFQEAVQQRDQGNYAAALSLLRPLADPLKDSVAYFAMVAHLHWELGDLPSAVEVFRHATGMAPTSETVSLGLFHCLWEQDDTDGAFDEMRRFLRLAESEEYRAILKGINQDSPSTG